MPTTAISFEATEYLCFIPTTAQDIFGQFQNRPNPDTNSDTIMDFVARHGEQIESLQDSGHIDDQAIAHVSLNADSGERMLDPKFETIFSINTLLNWVLDTLVTNDNCLKGIHRRLKQQAK